jgi:hypothetical protein
VCCNCSEESNEVESQVKIYMADEGYLVENARCGDKLMMEIRFSWVW